MGDEYVLIKKQDIENMGLEECGNWEELYGKLQIAKGYEISSQDNEYLRSQIVKLGDFITDEIPGEPSANEGAVDTAIRLLKDYVYLKSSLEKMINILKGGDASE